eukprot:TRINITY_DN1439_c0_g1_i1.p1 TRINITY_DN1439_c0_g1~~TRINITY_DN1439_c0_g1_i1.p1  ORF type:complete len:1077 (+),score=471.75 TRINITY_DN1439_c0_g1_i1:48-3278(+)
MALDEDLQSRQMAVYGRESMMKLSGAKVLVSGLNGLGAETAKNVILANVKSVCLQDDKKVVIGDLGANFYLSEKDVGKNRAEACKTQFQELNPSVEVTVNTSPLTPDLVKGFDVVVVCDSSLELACKVNDACRANTPPAHFIYGSVNGVFGSMFCDFGSDFVCVDTTGESAKTCIVEKIEKSAPGKQAVVQCVQDVEIDFDDGEFIVFSEVKGMTQLNDGVPRKIHDVMKGKKQFKIDDTSAYGDYISGGIGNQKKMPLNLKFRTLAECLKDAGQMTDTDTSKQSAKARAWDESVLEYFGKPEFEKKFGRSGLLLLAFRAIDSVGHEVACGEGGVEKVIAKAKELNEQLGDQKVEELDEERLKTIAAYAGGAGAVLNPLAAIFGGIMGQEVVKSCTGKFHPTFQWYHFDCEECLPDSLPKAPHPKGSRYDAQVQVFGKDIQEKLAKLNLFLVGSGALGCEFLKNFALMGCCTADSSKITVTDDDVIEKSNLSRQFLFRNHNIGQPKSDAASKVACTMNPALKVKSMTERVQPSSENIFDDDFWDGLDIVINALDNIKARLYVDSKCVLHTKPLLESGTLGPKCNTQSVIPHVTENYGATKDPPEKEAPQCALHNFPHNIDHCLGLAKSEFVGNYETVPTDANEFTKGPQKFVDGLLAASESPVAILDRLIGDPKFNCAMPGGLLDALVKERPSNFDQCIGWARRKYESYFVDRIKLLVHNCPEDMKTSSGAPFWSPPKRFPKVVPFDDKDEMAMKFIIAASNLRAKMFNISEEHRDPEYFRKVLKDVKIPEFTPFTTKVETGEEEQAEGEGAEKKEAAPALEEDDVKMKAAVTEIGAESEKHKEFKYFVNEFEKDQDDNFHIDFIQAFANLRARNYAIEEVDFLQAKLKAGRIIPAIATATAMATGLVCLEMLKVVGGKKGEAFRNTFCNLALPLYSQSEPAAADKVTSGSRFDPEMYMDVDEVAVPDPQTVWDTMVIPCSRNITVQGLVDWFNAEKQLTLEGWMFTGSDKKADSSPLSSRLGMKVTEYVEARGFPCANKKRLEIGDSPPTARVLELKTADGDDVKICRVVLQFTD